MSTAGEKPGRGLYRCTKCNEVVLLIDDFKELPPCPKCGNTTFKP